MSDPAVPGLGAWIASSLQRRLAVALAVVLILASALLLVVLSALYTARIAAENARASLQVNALLQSALENAMLKRDIPGLESILADLGRHEDIASVLILNPDLEVRFSSDPTLVGTRLDTAQTRAALASRTPQTVHLDDTGGAAVLRSVNPVPNQPPCQTCHGPITAHPVNGLLIVNYVVTSEMSEAQHSALVLGAGGLAAILAATAAIWALLRRRVIQPLQVLASGTEALAEGQLAFRVAEGGPDELGRLTRNFNAMAERLQTTMAHLNVSEAFLQGVIDAIPDGIRVIGPDFRILKANTAYAAHVGQSVAQIIGQPCHLSSHRRSAPCAETMVCCPLVDLKTEGARLTCRQTHMGPQGEEVHVEVAAARMTVMIDGQPQSCVVEAVRDLEQQVRISQEQRLSELGLLATGIAHEINNPLSSVELVLGTMQQDVAQGQADALPSRLAIIRTEIGRALSITESLLMLSLPPTPEPMLVDLERVAPSALSILTYQADRSNVRILCKIAPGLRIMGSESDTRMLITNLVLNAVHAMPNGGTVTVAGHRDQGWVILQVADTGHGIARRDLPKIFLPFWTRRADGSSGRGLGLPIVQAIVERALGKISVDSTQGLGSTFTVRFPDPDRLPDHTPDTSAPAKEQTP